MENFDLKKFLVENKLTANSRMLNEDANEVEYKGYIIKLNDYNYGNKPGVKYEFYNTNDPDESMGHGSSVEDCKDQIDSEMINERDTSRVGTDYEFIEGPEVDPLVAKVLEYLKQNYKEGVDFEYDSYMQRLDLYDDVNELSSDETLVDLLSDVFEQPEYEDGY